MIGDSCGVRMFAGGGTGGGSSSITIGNPVTGGAANAVLYEDGSQNLAADAGFTFNNGNALNLAETVVGGVFINSQNNDTTAASYAAVTANVGNSSIGVRAIYGGDAFTRYIVSGTGAADYALGYDRSATVFALSKNTDPGTNNVFTADGTTFTVVDDLVASGCAGTGTRVVQADASGKLTATLTTTGMTFNSQSAAYPTVLADANNAILHPTADNNPRTFTIDGSVSYPVGTTIVFVNQINTVTIAISTDTLTQAGTGSTGSRTLAAAGMATAIKVASGAWFISGSGLT